MKNLIEKVSQDFHDRYGKKPSVFSQAPGRINIIGEHTDYTGGLSLPAAIDCGTVCGWKFREDQQIKVYSANMEEAWTTSWEHLEKDIDKDWKKYVAGALILFHKTHLLKDPKPAGLDLSICGNVPLGKGLSSSASIELAILNGVNLLYRQNMTPIEMALMAQQVEHRYLKVKSGLLDQFASQFSQKNGALLIDFETLQTQTVKISPAFDNSSWVLVDSHVKRELASSKYSERVEEFQQAQDIAKKAGKLNLRQISSIELPDIFKTAPPNVYKRARHIISENERTMEAFKALELGESENLGMLLYETHRSLSEDYEVSHTNLDFIISTAKNIPGVVGGRMMGGGFGGCGLFLVRNDHQESFFQSITTEYEKFSGVKTKPLRYNFVDGASAWKV